MDAQAERQGRRVEETTQARDHDAAGSVAGVLTAPRGSVSQLLVSPMAGPVDPRRQGQALKEADVEPHEPRFKACLFLLCGLRPSTWPLWASVSSPAE